VTVSPTFAWRSSLMPAMTKPTSPAASSLARERFRREHADLLALVTCAGAPSAGSCRFGFSVPLTTRTSITTPT
jgi:hypothetical protein